MNLTEEEILLKDRIFDTFCNFHNASSTELHEKYKKEFRELNNKWCSDYRFTKKIKELEGLFIEIADISDRVITKSRYTSNKDGFFAYLYTALKNAPAAYYRNYEQGLIDIKKENRAKLKTIDKIKEDNDLTSDEQTELISNLLAENEYIDLLNMTKINPFSIGGDRDDPEIDTLNQIIPPLYPAIMPNNPQDEFIFKQDMEILREAVEFVINRKQKRVRKCLLALFSLHCYKKNPKLKEIYPILDKETLESCQTGTKNPRMYEIYMHFHPKASQKSSEARSSEVLTKFLGEVQAFIEGKMLNSLP
ncbi:MAG: hypothetical protein FWG89_02290 [Treponema sp.]|nr:hypothetical protein [Treponema sp.]